MKKKVLIVVLSTLFAAGCATGRSPDRFPAQTDGNPPSGATSTPTSFNCAISLTETILGASKGLQQVGTFKVENGKTDSGEKQINPGYFSNYPITYTATQVDSADQYFIELSYWKKIAANPSTNINKDFYVKLSTRKTVSGQDLGKLQMMVSEVDPLNDPNDKSDKLNGSTVFLSCRGL